MADFHNKTAAHMFGEYVANSVSVHEKRANPLALAARVAPRIAPAVSKAVGGAAKILRRPPPPLPVPFSMTAAAKAVNQSKIKDLATKYLGQIGSQADDAVQAVHGGFRGVTGRGGDAARYVANHTRNSLKAIGDTAARAGFNPENLGDVSKFFNQQGNRIKELVTNSIGAQRMAEGTLKVPRVKPVGFKDLNPAEWKGLTDSWDLYDDAVRRAAGT